MQTRQLQMQIQSIEKNMIVMVQLFGCFRFTHFSFLNFHFNYIDIIVVHLHVMVNFSHFMFWQLIVLHIKLV